MQRFLSAHDAVHNHVNSQRHLKLHLTLGDYIAKSVLRCTRVTSSDMLLSAILSSMSARFLSPGDILDRNIAV